jgi:hypothetical protein
MQKCKEDEHNWLVIEWVKGSYLEGQFRSGVVTGNDPGYRAQVFMCQRCLTKKTMNDIDLALYARQQQN